MGRKYVAKNEWIGETEEAVVKYLISDATVEWATLGLESLQELSLQLQPLIFKPVMKHLGNSCLLMLKLIF